MPKDFKTVVECHLGGHFPDKAVEAIAALSGGATVSEMITVFDAHGIRILDPGEINGLLAVSRWTRENRPQRVIYCGTDHMRSRG